MPTTTSSEHAKVGQSFDCILDTKYAGLGGLNTWRIYYKIGNGPTLFKAATVVETTKLLVIFSPSEINQAAKMRTWAYALGSGTAVFKGDTFIIPIDKEEG
jgi:hypothetical protein